MNTTAAIRARRRLTTLRRRRDYLAGLIEGERANSWDRAEHAALAWAIEELEDRA